MIRRYLAFALRIQTVPRAAAAGVTPYLLVIARLSEPGDVWFTLWVFR